VLANGRILWSRWNRANGRNGIHLYTANPDGTDVQLLYGAESHATGTNNSTIQFVRAHEMENGKTLALVRPFTYGTEAVFGGDLYIIDTANYVENNQPSTPTGVTGPAQSSATRMTSAPYPAPRPADASIPHAFMGRHQPHPDELEPVPRPRSR